MKVLVSIDVDGHFIATHPTDRKATLELLKKIDGGDYYHDIVENGNVKIPNKIDELCCQKWNNVIDDFTKRGVLEYIELPDTIPIACKCD